MPARIHRSLLLLTAAAMLLVGVSASGGAAEPVEQYGDAWSRYQQRSGHKALAVAVDDDLGVWAIASNEGSEQLAVRGALATCSARAAREMVDAQCRIVAIGDRLVDAAPERR